MKAIFKKDFNYSSRVRNVGWAVKASEKPQSFPRELIEVAVAAGVAEVVEPQRKAQTDTEVSSGE